MTEPALSLVNLETGEVAEPKHSYHDLLLLIERYEAEKNGDRLQIANLKRELRDLQEVEPEASDVKTVLTYWAKRVSEEGWWSRQPTFKPGSERWTVVSARLKDRWSAGDLCQVVEGALLQPKGAMKRPWLDATSIFRNERNCSQHFEHAHDPRCERIRAVRELPTELQRAVQTGEIRDLAKRCDCGHLRLHHSYPLQPLWVPESMVGWEPCRECCCMDFDTLMADHGRAA